MPFVLLSGDIAMIFAGGVMLVISPYENELFDENIDAYDDTLDNKYNDGIESYPEGEELLDNDDDDEMSEDDISDSDSAQESINESDEERIENEVFDELEE